MVSANDTLVIKHLPPDLSDSDKEELLKHYGAKAVKCISSETKKYNVIFARFQDERTAYHVLHRLHQLNINGTRLSVEFSKEKEVCEPEQPLRDFETEEEIENEKCYKKFIERLNSWHSYLNFKQPVPSHLRYQYPPPDNVVICNIAKALATVPKFYTQVLHLMNKMNLPCPFGKDILPDFNIQISSVANQQPQSDEVQIEAGVEADTESESEISSDDEVKKQRETIPDRVKVKKKVRTVPKFIKPMPARQGGTKQKKTSIEEVFEKIEEERESKKIKLSYPPMEEIQKISEPQETSQQDAPSTGFGFIHPVNRSPTPPPVVDVRNEMEEERLEKPEIVCISLKELDENRIPEKDRSVLSVFKNYAEGAPTSRLYIKNLAKTVTEEDLKYIYNRYLPQDALDSPVLDIRLMQEGRMKGQAFVTLHSVDLAKTALKETNGFILKEKPLVVQFARSAANKD
ncbi:UNVERIFIED_CONTAM: hypothetical protein PYX00_008441 [Menopon gallinae]|uniref:RNA-binding region-containing protein 3 n=1 Tax=Menopon gallinae TaxID=328185 RepID=A0AAW2HPM8_9NEOP